MTRQLHLGKGFTLPIDLITAKTAILAQSGAGKSTAGAGIVEELTKAGQQFVVLDPKGDWWGIRSSADGKTAGLPVTIFGGLHGDLPIYPDSGATIANIIVDEGISAVVDVSDFDSDAQRHRFTTDFAKAFYRAKLRSKSPVLFIIEEADESCPQQLVEATEAQMVGALKRIVKLGRFCGIGPMMVSQRSADVNKKILSQMQVLVVMRTWHETDLKAIKAALKDQVNKELFDEIITALPGMEPGEAYVVAPIWKLKQRVRFRERETFDAGETPKVGETRREPKVLAPVQLDALRVRLAAEIERAKADDPKQLRDDLQKSRKEVQRLQGELERRPSGPPKVIEKTVTVEKVPARVKRAYTKLQSAVAELDLALEEPDVIRAETARPPPAVVPMAVDRKAWAALDKPPAGSKPTGGVSGAEQRILDALVDLDGIGVQEPEQELVAFLAGYTHLRSKGFTNPRGALHSAGHVHYAGGRLSLTDSGRALAKNEPAPVNDLALQARVCQLLGGATERVLRPLIAAYPGGINRQDLAEQAEYGHVRSKGFTNALGRLRTLGFIDYRGDQVVAQPVLFPTRRATA
jgi:hypothetical protein